jgi:Flp pilus assembly protein TadG
MAKRLRGERGAELVEFAFALPLLLLVVAGIIDFGLLFKDYEVVTNAAREGARLGTLPDYTPADIQARVTSYAVAGGLVAGDVSVPAPTTVPLDLGGGKVVTAIQVTVSYPHTFWVIGPIASLVGGSFGTVNLTASSTMRVEIP